jgi:hypothetical protein
MDSLQFVQAIRQVVRDSAVASTNTLSLELPDRRQWMQSLDSEGQRHLQDIVALTAHVTVFGFLCVLDGVRAIESGPNKGDLELRYRGFRGETLLNDPEREPLHDLYMDVSEPLT